jgi:hypothetical protein
MTDIQVGDKGLVFAAGSPYSTFSAVSTPAINDTVILYNLGNGQRLAVPTLWFNLGDFTFVTPSFQFAGFDFKLDFNFNLTPLKLGFPVITEQYSNFSIHNTPGGGLLINPPSPWQFGDDDPSTPSNPVGVNLKTDGTGYKYPVADFAFLFENYAYGSMPDAFIDVRRIDSSHFEIWAGAPTGYVGDYDIEIFYGGTLLKSLTHYTDNNLDYHGILEII